MMCSNDTPEVFQNLLDAGCDSKLVDRFMLLFAHKTIKDNYKFCQNKERNY